MTVYWPGYCKDFRCKAGKCLHTCCAGWVIGIDDESLKRFDYVYPAAGSSNSAIKLTLEELEKYSNYVKWVDVCKLPE